MRVLLPGSTVGVLGAGQLGRMFAIAAARLGYRVISFAPEKDSPASHVALQSFVASYDDEEQLDKFSSQIDGATIEFENIPASALKRVAERTVISPSPDVLFTTQHRLREKTFLSSRGFPTARFIAISSASELAGAIDEIGLPAVLKTAGFGYDGKGQKIIRSREEAFAGYQLLGAGEMILEQLIDIQKEISVIGGRSHSGEFCPYGPVENKHENHILDITLSPARISTELKKQALEITAEIMRSLSVVGLLCVEFFLDANDSLLVNELAPRPHNSGHYSIEACSVSQFEQQLRILAGLPLGNTAHMGGAAMVNLLGDTLNFNAGAWYRATAQKDVYIHLYGKREARPGRKMGHITALSGSSDEAMALALSIRALLYDGN